MNMRIVSSTILVVTFSISAFAGSSEINSIEAKKTEVIIGRIISTIGLKPNFEVEASDTYTASATILNGKRFIFYNPTFFAKLNNETGTEWSSISILAHEIGHHLNGHTLSGGKISPEIELEADEFSGFVLCKMGASLAQSELAMKRIANTKDSHTHPARDKRLIAIEAGWNKAKLQQSLHPIVSDQKVDNPVQPLVSVKNNPQTKQAVHNPQNKPRITNSGKYLRYTVRLKSQPGITYYITAQNNLVRKYNNQFFVVGKIKSSSKSAYPYLLIGKNSNYFISKTGNVVDEYYKHVGIVKEIKS